jgi:uncharacterized protein (TIGR03067 family)
MAAAILLPAGALSAGDEKKTDKEKLQGEWTLVKAIMGGKELDADKIKEAKPLVIKGDQWRPPFKGPKLTFTIDPSKTPKHLDLRPEGAGDQFIYKGIYKLEGDTLTFCRGSGPAIERPKEFKGGEAVGLLVFKRAGK